MRIIDADKLLNKIDAYMCGSQDVMFVKELIKEQPTAFDVDKVVEQLEKEIKENPYQSEYLAGLYKAIEIVKAGEV